MGRIILKVLSILPAVFILFLFVTAFFILPSNHPYQSAEIILSLNKTIFPEILGISSGLLLYKGICT